MARLCVRSCYLGILLKDILNKERDLFELLYYNFYDCVYFHIQLDVNVMRSWLTAMIIQQLQLPAGQTINGN